MNEDYLLVQSIQDYAIFMLNTEGIIVSWNEGARRIKGYTADEIIGKHFSIFFIPEDIESKKPERELKIAKETGRYEEEGWRKRKDGSRFWANVIITPVFNEKKEHIGFSKITRDLSERKRTEELLKQSEERYRLLVEQVEDYGIFLLDEKGHVSSWNEGAERITGYKANEILGKHFSIFYPPEDVASKKPDWELQVAEKEGKYEEEGWRIRKNGSRYWVGVVITAIFSNGKLIGFAKVTRDLTERKKAESQLRESSERYRVLAEELNKTNIQLSGINKQLEQFASIASHDLKEPLRKVTVFTDLVLHDKENKLSDTSEQHLSKVIDASRRMTKMIEDILSFSSVSQTQIFDTVSLQQVLDEAIGLLEELIKEKKALITSDQLPNAKVIPSQFRQLFQNLIANSIKFARPDVPPRINITHRYLNEHDGVVPHKGFRHFLELNIEDNGIGFEQKESEKIFELFKRLHSRNEYAGTGIGLAVVKKIVENHEGIITAESGKDKGALFRILLPVE